MNGAGESIAMTLLVLRMRAASEAWRARDAGVLPSLNTFRSSSSWILPPTAVSESSAT